jgi:hypothetical protein
MQSPLHVLNGDSTWHAFKQTGIPGDVIIWREAFSEGPLLSNIRDRDFWIAREQWINKTWGASKQRYQQGVIDELEPLKEEINYAEIILWFEFDLHCQANLLGALQLLKNIDLKTTNLYLISPSGFAGKDIFRGMGELSPDELKSLLPNKIRLSNYDMEIADQVWQMFTAPNVIKLQAWLNEHPDFGALINLEKALWAHIRRSIPNEQGLNYVEAKLYEIYKGGVKDRIALYTQFWNTETIFGMGDAELDVYLQRLKAKGFIEL